MRKSFLYIIGMLCMSLILLIASVATVSVNAQPPAPTSAKLYVDPLTPHTFPQIGSNYTITVNITDLDFNLMGFEFKMWYNTTLLDASLTESDILVTYAFVAPTDPITGDWIPVNETIGLIYLGVTTSGFISTDKDLIQIHFTAKQLGVGVVKLNESEIVNNLGTVMDVTEIDSFSVTVIPEFPATLVMPLLLTTTLTATLLGKMVWSRKRKDALTAE